MMKLFSNIYFQADLLAAIGKAAADSAAPISNEETVKFIVRDWLITNGYLVVDQDVEWRDAV